MRRTIFRNAGLMLALGAAPLSAQWTYTFTGTWDFNDGHPQTMAFTLTNATPITTAGLYATSSCSITPDVVGTQQYQCDLPEFDPNGFGTGYNFISARFTNFDDNSSGGGGAFFFFDPLSFSTIGTYLVAASVPPVANPLYDPTAVCDVDGSDDLCREFNYYGSAGAATLTVSASTQPPGDVVPEPATLTLLATGLVGMGAGRRKKRG